MTDIYIPYLQREAVSSDVFFSPGHEGSGKAAQVKHDICCGDNTVDKELRYYGAGIMQINCVGGIPNNSLSIGTSRGRDFHAHGRGRKFC